jgi:hypothetical protein
MKLARMVGTAVFALAAAAAMAVSPASVASAHVGVLAQDRRCTTVASGTNDVCVIKEDGMVWGEITGSVLSDPTLIVWICDGFGDNCGRLSANHGRSVSKKPVSFGHTYKADGTFTDIIGNRWNNVYSPYVTGN